MSPRLRTTAIVGAAVACTLLAPPLFHQVRLAIARGLPSSPELVWRGVITQGTVPVTGSHTLHFALYGQANGGSPVCDTGAVTVTLPADGSITQDLSSCASIVEGNSDLWLDVQLDAATTFPRTKLGAAPYAIEAKNAQNADRASSAAGALETRLAALEAANTALQLQLTTLQSQATSGWCPRGYTHDTSSTSIVLCTKTLAGTVYDEIVRVGGDPASQYANDAFWIDRYEPSAWAGADGSGVRYGSAASAVDDYPAGFNDNGNGTTQVYALSRSGVFPSGSLTWFQANLACQSSGKHLVTLTEWFRAIRGTQDPLVSNGTGGYCNTMSSSSRITGLGTNCRSAWGAEDMIGNVSEWSAEWYAGLGNGTATVSWPDNSATGYGGDGTWNITSYAFPGGGPIVQGLPAAAIRGGDCGNGLKTGAFHLYLGSSPADWYYLRGFRCATSG